MTMPITGSAEATYPRPARSVAQMLVDRVDATPRREALRFPTDHGWEALSWEQVGQQSYDLAAGLLALGLTSEQRVALICSTRYEWILADLAVMCAGGATTSGLPLDRAGGRRLHRCRLRQPVRLRRGRRRRSPSSRPRRHELPDVEKVIVIDGEGDGDWVLSWRDLARLGADYLREHPSAVERRHRHHRAGPPGDAHLHLGHDRPPQGRRARPVVLDL